jgi:hypothetical protein
MTAIDPVPIDPVRQLHQFVFPVDDLLQPSAEQITDPAVSCFFGRIVPSDVRNHACRFEGIAKTKLQGFDVPDHETWQSQIGRIAEN